MSTNDQIIQSNVIPPIIYFFSNHKFDENNEVVQKDKDRKDKKAKKKKKKDKKKNKGKVT